MSLGEPVVGRRSNYERNQRLIADNANGKGMMVRGAVRNGEALLAGLLRCGHCGRRLLVSYNGTKGDIGRYHCDATRSNPAAAPCISSGALCIDQAVGVEIVRLLRSQTVSTSLARNNANLSWRSNRRDTRRSGRGGNMMQSILTNRLVAGELERRWNVALVAVDKLEKELEALIRQRPVALGAEERQRLLQMAPTWKQPGIIRRRPPSRASG